MTAALFQNMEILRERYMRRAKIVEYEKGAVIRRVEGPNPAILSLSSGFVGLYRPLHNGEEQLFAPIFRNTTFNVLDMVEGRNWATVRTFSKSIVYELDKEGFMSLRDDPMFWRWCLWVLARNNMMLSEYGTILSISNLDSRLMEFFKSLHFQQAGYRPVGSFTVEWDGTQEIMASLLKVSRPYLSERMKYLHSSGKVRRVRSGIYNITAD